MADLAQGEGERGLIYGGTRSGKSSFLDWCMRFIQETRPDCMILVADTKPRFKAENVVQKNWHGFSYGRKPAAETRLYEGWAAGPVLPNSVAVDMTTEFPFRSLWDKDDHPGEIAIMQSDVLADWKQMLRLMRHFTAKKTTRERIIVVDEGMDFYQRNTLSIDPQNDEILRTARAGGERNIGLMFGAHRPHGIPPLLNTLSSRVTLFHLRYERDMHYLYEMGVPEEDSSPTEPYVFRQYEVKPGGSVSKPIQARLRYPESYLKQLSAT
jgi:hypothetical protein